MEHNRKQKLLMIVALIVGIASLSIGFAAFSTTLNISSSASVLPNSAEFSVMFSADANALVTREVVPSENEYNLIVTNGVINNSSSPTISGLSVTFTEPGQSVSFQVYVRNEGKYTAYLNGVRELGGKVCKGEDGTTESLVQSTCYDISRTIVIAWLGRVDGEVTNYPLEPGESTLLTILFEYSSMGARADGPFTMSFPNIALVYSTIDDSTIMPIVPENTVRLVSGNLDTVGSVVSIGNEQFYVIGQENGNVKLFAMYNLLVGNRVDYVDEALDAKPLISPTGIQDSTARGYVRGEFPYIGTTPFSNTSSVYSGSIVEGYVDGYKNVLESEYGVEVVEARLISYDELTNEETFACVEDSYCSDNYPWIYSTSYWSQSSLTSKELFWVNSNKTFGYGNCVNPFRFGVRPVIIISKSYF